MRVVIVSKALVSEVYRRKLVALADLGLDVFAVVPPMWAEGGSEQRLEPVESSAYTLIETPLRLNGHFHLHYYPDLAGILDDLRPDLLHMDEEPYNVATYLGVRAATRRGIPSVFFSWQNLWRRYPPPFSWIERSVYAGAEGALAGSESVQDVLLAKGFRGDVTVVPQFGVDPTVFFPRDRAGTSFTVGMFNRLIPAKSPIECVEAFARLDGDCRMVVVGDGPLRPQLERRVHQLGLQDRVALQPRVPSTSMPGFMAAVDVVLLFSRTTRSWTEQFGRVLIEGMASGAVVVGSDSGEIPWVIGDAGLVVPEGDVEALSGALERLQRDRSLRADLRAAGMHRVQERFTNARIAEKTVGAYQRAVG